MIRLTQTGSKWGNLYRFRHYVDGRQVSRDEWERRYSEAGCSPESGEPMESTDYGFRKTWSIEP